MTVTAARARDETAVAAGDARWWDMELMALGLGVLGVYLARLMWLVRLPDRALVGYLPDDAFYYIRLAKNFAASGRWTFDGVASTTGFHLLWAYLLAGVYWVFPGLEWRGTFLLAGVMGSVCVAVAAVLMGAAMRKVFGRMAVWVVGCVFLSSAVMPLTTFVMEASLALLCIAGAVYLVGAGETRGWAMFCVGVAGTLSRSDFGLNAAVLLVCFGVAWGERQRRSTEDTKGHGGARRGLAMLFLGALVAVGLVMAHCFLISGRVTQASAQEKLLWSGLLGNKVTVAVATLLGNVEPIGRLTKGLAMEPIGLLEAIGLAIVFGVAVLFARRARRDGTYEGGLRWVVFAGALGCGYMAVYRYDSAALQPWYLVNFVVPIVVVLCALVMGLRKLVGAAALAVPGVLMLFGVAYGLRPLWPDQAPLMEAGVYLREHPLGTKVGAWNAGLMDYFSGGQVVNLDGLVNDDIYPYSQDQRLLEYLDNREIGAIADYEAQTNFGAARLGMTREQIGGGFGLARRIGVGSVRWLDVYLRERVKR